MDAAIDWLYLPRFDSPTVLDANSGGEKNLLESLFTTGHGAATQGCIATV